MQREFWLPLHNALRCGFLAFLITANTPGTSVMSLSYRNVWLRIGVATGLLKRFTNGVPCYPGSCSEIYLEKAFDNTGWRPAKRLPVAQVLGETSLMFLVHPTLKPAEIELTYSVLQDVMASATRHNH
jgi:dTDP-4-amino-4,6-dideoxygalactose transaminase